MVADGLIKCAGRYFAVGRAVNPVDNFFVETSSGMALYKYLEGGRLVLVLGHRQAGKVGSF